MTAPHDEVEPGGEPDPAPRTPRLGVRARLARQATPQHVGERVSIRHLVTDPQRGPRPTDVVGRLLAMDDDLLLVVDRRAHLHTIAVADVLASRIVPPHPRLEPEPPVPTSEAPLVRRAARVLVIDRDDRVLLVAHHPTADESVWTAPGGGLEDDEDHRTAARREVVEELGLDTEPGPCVLLRQAAFTFRGVWLEQHEQWFLVRVDDFDHHDAPLDDAGISRARWWSLAELQGTDAHVEPRRLAELLAHVIEVGVPDPPWTFDE
ncbi:MAG: NUDIX domain-containing protein [Nitriliruptoraceae bacterium]